MADEHDPYDETKEESLEASRRPRERSSYRVLMRLVYQPGIAPDDVNWQHITLELVLLSAFWNSEEAIPETQTAYAKRMGQELFRMGGMDLMQRVYREVTQRNPYATVLQYCWDQIGDWQA